MRDYKRLVRFVGVGEARTTPRQREGVGADSRVRIRDSLHNESAKTVGGGHSSPNM